MTATVTKLPTGFKEPLESAHIKMRNAFPGVTIAHMYSDIKMLYDLAPCNWEEFTHIIESTYKPSIFGYNEVKALWDDIAFPVLALHHQQQCNHAVIL